MIRVKHAQDFWAGLLFLAIGIFAALIARNYVFGTATRMGPGYLPSVLSWMLIALGAFLTLRGMVQAGPGIERSLIRPQFFIVLAIVIFGLLIERLGLVPSVVAAAIVASLASSEKRWRETLILAAGLAIACSLLFIKLLGQPLEVWKWNF